MIVYERLASIEKMLEEAKKLPLSSKLVIDGDEMGLLLREIKSSLPEELKHAKWISEERKKIITNAQVEADEIIKETKEKVNEHEIVEMAKKRAEELIAAAKEQADAILEEANETSAQIKKAAIEYTDKLLEKIESDLDGFLAKVKENRDELK
jgi:geranylgeranyl pyrophosphate synthase